MTVAIVTFVVVLLAMTAAGAMSIIRKKTTPEDYLIASRDVPPWLTALSTVGTNNSGFMFVGMIAYTYRVGISSVWMMVGWIVGDLAAWFLVHPRVRETSDDLDVNTLPDLIGTRRSGRDRWIVAASGAVTFVFLAVYAAGQLQAGSTALHALFGWDMAVGALVGTAIVLLYSYAGGIRADIWTDAAQSFVMIVSMVAIVVAGWWEVGGPAALGEVLRGQDPALLAWFPADLAFGPVPFVLGFLAAGFGVVGQPHLMTRLMAVSSREDVPRARLYYFAWFVPFFAASVAVGLYARAVLPDLAAMPVAQGLDEPTELALPLVSMALLPQVFVGFALAGLFAAAVSTADSQIIVCSGAVTQDILPRWRETYAASKFATGVTTALSLGIALLAPDGVFFLVLIAWSALGAALGPVLVVRLFDRPLATGTALTMMAVAIAVVVGWQVAGLDDDLFKMLPGMLAAALVYAGARALARLRAAISEA